MKISEQGMDLENVVLPDYEEVANHLFWLSETCSVSYLHGMLCAYICGGSTFDTVDWMQTQIEKNLNKKALNIPTEVVQRSEEILQILYDATESQLNSDDFLFEILLPSETEDVIVRTQAMSEWCNGFMTELEKQIQDRSFYSDDAKEALEHLDDTVNIDLQDLEQDEEHEKAFFEVVEYIRLAIILIFMETSHFQEGLSPITEETIH